jgi:hypothetical protein
LTQPIIKQSIAFDDLTITVSATGTAAGFGSTVVANFPEGNVLFLGATSYVSFTGSGSDANLVDTWNGDYSMSDAPLATAVIDTDAERNIIYTTAVGAAVAEAVAETRGEKGGVYIFDNTDGSLEINLNLTIDAADIADDTSVDITAAGILHLAYLVLGDD